MDTYHRNSFYFTWLSFIPVFLFTMWSISKIQSVERINSFSSLQIDNWIAPSWTYHSSLAPLVFCIHLLPRSSWKASCCLCKRGELFHCQAYKKKKNFKVQRCVHTNVCFKMEIQRKCARSVYIATGHSFMLDRIKQWL